MSVDAELTKELKDLSEEGRERSMPHVSERMGAHVRLQGKSFLNFSSNDYLGLGADPELLKQFYAAVNGNDIIDKYAPGSTGSRLLCGNNPMCDELESFLSQCYGRDALLFSSGYHANIGILPAIAGRGDLILCDKLNHASIIDGIRLSRAEMFRYRHADMNHLRNVLEERRHRFNRVFIVTESVFSMDGDIADIVELVKLKKEYDVILYLDEAHAVGVRGKRGLGVAEELNVLNDIDILVGTFGKAFASMGSYAIVGDVMRRYLLNKSRAFIFTTAMPPVIAHWNRWIFEKVLNMGGARKRLGVFSSRLRECLQSLEFETLGESHIIPLVVGTDTQAVALAESFQEQGILVFPIRPPTVPIGTARLRFSLSAGMNDDDLTRVIDVIKRRPLT